MRIEKLSAPRSRLVGAFPPRKHTKVALLHREDNLQGSAIPAVISPSRLVPTQTDACPERGPDQPCRPARGTTMTVVPQYEKPGSVVEAKARSPSRAKGSHSAAEWRSTLRRAAAEVPPSGGRCATEWPKDPVDKAQVPPCGGLKRHRQVHARSQSARQCTKRYHHGKRTGVSTVG